MRARVLIVDDEVVITSALRRALSHEHEVTVLNSALEALALLRGGSEFDVILCDLMMPRMSGAQLYREVARFSPRQAAATVLMTGGLVPPDAADLLASGVRRLAKPFNLDELRTVIAQLGSGVPGPHN